jgi:hypothetical protein
MFDIIKQNLKWIICLVLNHDWKVSGQGLPESAWPEEYSICAFCGEDSRPTWAIEDDTICRTERLILLSRGKGERTKS